MRILFAGTPDVAVASLDAIVAAGHEVVGVLTRADAPAGRGRKLIASPVSQRAQELGLPVFTPHKVADIHDELVALAPDLAPVVAYGQLIRAAELAIPHHGWINLHFSLLPRWRGAAPVQRAIMAGDTEIGAAVFRLVPELDAGPIYRTRTDAVSPTDNSDTVLTRLAHSGAELLVEAIAAVEAGEVPVPQPEVGITQAAKITVDDAFLDLSTSAVELDRLIRGCYPNPGAWTLFRGERFKVIAATPVSSAEPLAPGQLRVTKKSIELGTGTVALRLDTVQAAGKKPMAGPDWARGANITATDRMGS
ncbi:MAG: methionyl-tRNA formyltransferase [Propionibacteriaceae bacterium]